MSRCLSICHIWVNGLVGFLSVVLLMIVGTSSSVAFDAEEYLTTKPYEKIFDSDVTGKDAIDIGQIIADDQEAGDSVVEQLLDGLGFKFDSDQKIIQFVANLINFLLAIVGLVALGMLIYAFYKIFRSDGDEAFKDARSSIGKIFLALIIIGLARFIAGRAFDLYFTVTEG